MDAIRRCGVILSVGETKRRGADAQSLASRIRQIVNVLVIALLFAYQLYIHQAKRSR